MIELTFSTEEPQLIELAQAYWSQDDAGAWKFKLADLERSFEVARGRVRQRVADVCEARAAAYRCPSCDAGSVLISRADYESLRRAERWSRAGMVASHLICQSCRAAAARQQREAAEAAARAIQEAVRTKLNDAACVDLVQDYSAMGLRHAFLLDGLLRYAGEAWQGETLAAWELDRLKLCDTETDLRSVFRELSQAGWLAPDANSPLDAFALNPSGEVTADLLRVRYRIAADAGGRPFSEILEVANAVQQSASADELRPIWEWVSMCEIRGHFTYCQEKWKFRNQRWGPALESSSLRLLSECSLGVAKTVMWKCFKHLASELQRGVRPAQHTFNMLPGSLQRTHDYYRGQGWPIAPWRPMSDSIYSHHLFNRLMGDAVGMYDHLTGSDLSGATGLHRPHRLSCR